MARPIHTRWKIHGTLTAETPIHVGGMGGDADTDLALAVNGQGDYYIPGTSLAGALRGWMGRSQDVNALWGFQDKTNGHASFIIIEDAPVTLPHAMTIEIREGVGIDRHTGTAADKIKYSRAILPKGVTFPLKITLDCQTDQSPHELWNLLFALENGDIRIGAAKTRGLGKVSLQVTTIEKHDLNNAQGLFNSLLQQNLQQDWQQIKQETINHLGAYTSPSRLSLDITWKPRDPVMVKAEGDGIAVDILPLVSQATGKAHFVIPGSSIKGVLRTHAERIVRTLLGIDFDQKEKGKSKFSEQIKLSKANKSIELVDVIFGSAEKSQGKNSEGKIASLTIDDCYATISMNPSNWSAIENATSMAVENLKPLVNTAIGKTESRYKTLQPAMHVAVDRWTGGAADGMLYSVLEPIGVEWNPISIQVDLERLKKYGEDNVKPAIALLLLVLWDFADRKIPIGYGTNRGMGTVEVTEMQMNCSLIDGLPGIEGKTTITRDLPGLHDHLHEQILTKLTTAWQTWIDQNQEAA